ncbi:transcriptional regulator [Bifidobacterium ramosum]|uniref:Transcriptional regulator n=1 Tax=Bifidobacterium ramosum TaxID=1798158 RepID=A0A6L4X209_9BIFI|nr:winged helix-turn-helix domain-containing protein [Bifidobacterium ramosum]KAB8287677.1 transcriptional regulator [Bifidobacterium ramosum]NEG72293.1 transcriptional regulator [Bifidobacterium ramosum]
MEILFVTGSAALASAVSRTLESAGHTAFAATTVDEFDRAIADHVNGPFDAVLVDDLTPAPLLDRLTTALDDASTATAISSATIAPSNASPSRTPTQRHDRRPRIALLVTPSMASNDDVRNALASRFSPDVTIVKPFGDAELLSYMALLQNDDPTHDDVPTLLIHGDLTLDTHRQRAYYRGTDHPIALSPREYSALEALIRADGEFLSFDELSRLVFGDGAGFADRRSVMDTTMYSLTRKLRRLGFFITQHGHHYRIR